MPAPSAVVFDLGKVLLDFDYAIASRRLAPQSGLTPAEMLRHLDYSPLLFRYETGTVTREEFYADIVRHTGYTGSLAEFSAAFGDIFTEIPVMIALHAELRRRGVPTYIFSNTNDLAIEHIRRQFPFFAGFDGYIFSHEVGAMKPQPQIYEALEVLCGRRGRELIYLDDRLENVEAGAARGWQVIHHADPAKSHAALRIAGLPV